MAYKILFTEDALADLETILDFIRADNQSAAEEFGEALLDHINLLRDPADRNLGSLAPQCPKDDPFTHPDLLPHR